MKKILTLLISTLLIAFLCSPVHSEVVAFDGIEYTVNQDTVPCLWDAPSTGGVVEKYQVESVWIDPSSARRIYSEGETTTTEQPVSFHRAGHFMFRVRACNVSGCGDWAESTNSVDAGGTKWKVFWKLPPPIIIIE